MRSFAKKSRSAKRALQGLAPAGVLSVAAATAVDGQESASGAASLRLSPAQVLAQGERPIGLFTRASDQVDRLYKGEKFGTVIRGEDALSNETLSSYGDGAVTIKFLDGTQLSIGPNSDVILDEYVYDPEANTGRMSLSILSGVVKFISGKMSSESYEIDTPVGMVAIRGTELVFLVEPDGDTSLAIVSGGVSVSLEGQAVEASAEDGRVTLLTFAADVPGLFQVQGEAVADPFRQIDRAFEQPSSYSSAVAQYKTALAKDGILSACIDGQSCDAAVETLVDDLAELGVDKADVTASLDTLRDALDGVSDSGSAVIDRVAADVARSYEPKVKGAGDGGSSQPLADPGVGFVLPGLVVPVIPLLLHEETNSPPVFTSGTAVSFEENEQGTVYLAQATDPDNDDLSFILSGGADAALFNLDEDELVFLARPDFENPLDDDRDNVYEVEIQVSDGKGGEATQRVLVTVTDVNEGNEFWSDAMINDNDSVLITGSGGDSFVGYLAADPNAEDPLTEVGRGVGNVATFDMSAGGSNSFRASSSAGSGGGKVDYIGGPGTDDLAFGSRAAEDGGVIHINLGADQAADRIEFEGTVGSNDGDVRIFNFNSDTDSVVLSHLQYAFNVTANNDYEIVSNPGFVEYKFILVDPDGVNVLDGLIL